MRNTFAKLLIGIVVVATFARLTPAEGAGRELVVEPTVTMSGTRVALVVGVANYAAGDEPSAPSLTNPVKDARAMRDMLTGLGFRVVYGEDLTKSAFESALDTFEDSVRQSDLALVYFSGHGSTFNGQPYLVPADAAFSEIRKTVRQLIPVEDVLARLREAKGVRIALIDACRDNAVEQALKQAAAGTKAMQSRGLGRVSGADGMIVMYAAQHLQTAADGDDGHSPFARALLAHLPTPDVDVTTVLWEVARDVIRKTGSRQKPELVIDLFDKFTLVQGKGEAAAAPLPAVTAPVHGVSPPAPAGEGDAAVARAFETVKALDTVDGYNAFIAQYGDTFYAKLAAQLREKRAKLPQAEEIANPAVKDVGPVAIASPTLTGTWAGPVRCRNGQVFEARLTIYRQTGEGAEGRFKWSGSNTGTDGARLSLSRADDGSVRYDLVTARTNTYDYTLMFVNPDTLRGRSTGPEGCEAVFKR